MSRSSELSVSGVVRGVFATATVVFLALGVFLKFDPRLLGAGAACGTIWWLWDLFVDEIVRPVGDWFSQGIVQGGLGELPSNDLPSLDDTIRLLEGHLEHGASRHVEINAAIRLEEIYRMVKHDPDRARAVVARVLERYPDSPELQHLRQPAGDQPDRSP
jgi:hypothetical protein